VRDIRGLLMTPITNVNLNNTQFNFGSLFTQMHQQMSVGNLDGSLNLSSMSLMSSNDLMQQYFDFMSKVKFDFSQFNLTSASAGAGETSVQEGHCRANVKLDQAFLNRVKQIAAKINCDYKDLLAIMHSESGLNSKAVNRNGGATGLIQFMPSTAKALGTTTDALKNMTPIQQLDYVEKFFEMNLKNTKMQGKRLSAGDLYTLVFMPAKVHGEVICQAGSKEYAANKGLDANKDGVVTKSELGNRIISHRVDESIFA